MNLRFDGHVRLLESRELGLDAAFEVEELGIGVEIVAIGEAELHEIDLFLDVRARRRLAFGRAIAAEHQRGVGDLERGADIVRDDEQRVELVHVADLDEQLDDLVERRRIEAGERLVHEQQHLLADQLLRDREALCGTRMMRPLG